MSDSITPVAPRQGFVLGDKLYDKVKFVVQIIIPGLATLYAALAGFWSFPHVQEVVGTLTAIALFLGLLLGQSSKNFIPPVPPAVEGQPVGSLIATTTEEGKTLYTLALTSDPESFADQDHILFDVRREENSL